LFNTVDELGHHPAWTKEIPMRTPFQFWKQTLSRVPLGSIKTTKGLFSALREYENQEPINMVAAFKCRQHPQVPFMLEGAIAEAMAVADVIDTVDNNMLVDPAPSPKKFLRAIGKTRFRLGGRQILKYPKGLRKNRYKSKS
jgi:hypothetical protein